MVEIAIEDPDQPQVLALLEQRDALMGELYPAESNHLFDVSALQKPQVTFVVVRMNGQAVGCAALVKSGKDWAEIKSMYVSSAARGLKLGRLLLQKIEALAAEGGAGLLRLETGIKQPEALSLYRSAGFAEIAHFGHYGPDPLSVFMEKRV